MNQLSDLPTDLPVPADDGGADHLLDMAVSDVSLLTTNGESLNLSETRNEWLVLYVYPMTGRPDVALPDGWEQIPGARGCTPQSCAFRDHNEALASLGARVVGLSVQDSDYQAEMVERLHLPYPVVSDSDRAFGDSMRLPTMTVEMKPGVTETLYKRLTLIIRDGVVKHVMYPVFPPDANAADVEAWISQQ